MGTTQPIRDKEDLRKLLNYYKEVNPHPRNYTMIAIGLHTALRISDILHLRWSHVYDFERNCYLEHLHVVEQKTGKPSFIALNDHVKDALSAFQSACNPSAPDYLFTKTTAPDKPLSREQAYRIIKKAARNTSLGENISCHSLRKTFGYYAWKQGTSPVLLMEVYNHSSFEVTKRYLGISQDERDSIFLNVNY